VGENSRPSERDVPELLEREQDPAGRRARDAGEVGDLAQGERRALAREHLDDRHPALERLQRLLSITIGNTLGLRRLGHRADCNGASRPHGQAVLQRLWIRWTHTRSLRAPMG
jgi:hypothetical protein